MRGIFEDKNAEGFSPGRKWEFLQGMNVGRIEGLNKASLRSGFAAIGHPPTAHDAD
jgi:hypothetical protein